MRTRDKIKMTLFELNEGSKIIHHSKQSLFGKYFLLGNTMNIKSFARTTASVLLIFALVFTALPAAAGSLDSSAASSYIKKLSASATGTSSVKLTWTKLSKKQQKKVTGIAVFRNGKLIKRLGKGASTYTDTNLKAATAYKYQIKTYKKTTKKVKMWYNKKTKKWQTKKPAKKYRGKKKSVKKPTYKYSNPSPVKKVTTKAAAKPAPTGSNSSGNSNAGDTSNGSGNTSGSSASGNTQPTTSTETKTVTDFLGVTRKITKNTDSAGVYWTYITGSGGTALFDDSEMACYDKTVNGEFTYQGWVFKQVNGATFQIKGSGNLTHSIESPGKAYADDAYLFNAYNVDAGKLTFSPQSGVTLDAVSSYTWPYLFEKASGTVDELKPVTKTYVIKNGKRIARLSSTPIEVKKDKILYHVYPSTDGGTGVMYADDFTVDIKYDGKYIGTLNIKKSEETTDNGMVPLRRLALDICQAAIDWAASSEGKAYYEGHALPDEGIYRDFRYIKDYMAQNYTYNQSVSGYGTETGNLHCTVCAYILETWAVYKYDKDGLGFLAWGHSNSIDHVAYHLNNDPGYDIGEINLPH